ncbi:MAG: hypothetical protein NT029_17980 [Armatimonadetes bacterium]|nr:hypothetical protein [Armatimonadota bacterium]
MHRSDRRRRRRRVVAPEVQCPRCLYVAAHLRGGQLRRVFRWLLLAVVGGIFLVDLFNGERRLISNLTTAAPELGMLALGALFLPKPRLYCQRCEQQKAKKKSDDAGSDG